MKPDLPEPTDRETVESIFHAIPYLKRNHKRHDPLFIYLDKKVLEYYDSIQNEKAGIGPFSELKWARFPSGNLTSYMFFCLGEFILYYYYWKNHGSYKTFFDIGSHIGIDAIIASCLGYEVWCFEPDPVNFEILQENIRANKRDDIHPYCMGISSMVGNKEYVRVEGNTTASHIVGSREYYGDSKLIDIRTTTFDEIGFFPDLMKINVEGHEDTVIATIPIEAWETTDAFVEVHNEDKRYFIFNHFDKTNVNIFSQKIGWEKAEKINECPKWNTEGYIFISTKDSMNW